MQKIFSKLMFVIMLFFITFTNTYAVDFIQKSIRQTSSAVANNDPVTAMKWNSVVLDISNIIQDIGWLKIYIDANLNTFFVETATQLEQTTHDIKIWKSLEVVGVVNIATLNIPEGWFKNSTITTNDIKDGTILLEDLDPNISFGSDDAFKLNWLNVYYTDWNVWIWDLTPSEKLVIKDWKIKFTTPWTWIIYPDGSIQTSANVWTNDSVLIVNDQEIIWNKKFINSITLGNALPINEISDDWFMIDWRVTSVVTEKSIKEYLNFAKNRIYWRCWSDNWQTIDEVLNQCTKWTEWAIVERREIQDITISTPYTKVWVDFFKWTKSLDATNADRLRTMLWGKCWQLLYQLTRDWASSVIWHSKVNNKGETVTVYKWTNITIAWYTSSNWWASWYQNNSTWFIANLTTNQKSSSLRYPQYSIYANNSYWPTFGWGHDLSIDSNMNYSYANYHSYYSHPFNGQNPWTRQEIETFKVVDCSTITFPDVITTEQRDVLVWWDWDCEGINWGTTKSCFATKYIPSVLYDFTTHTFSNCWASGSEWPSLAQCVSTYNTHWDENIDFFWMTTNGIQEWTVPSSWDYVIEAAGAKWGWVQYEWWRGVIMKWTFTLAMWDVLKILVWQEWLSNGGAHWNENWGWGWTYVVKKDNTKLIIAWGGWGWPSSSYWTSCWRTPVWDALYTTDWRTVLCYWTAAWWNNWTWWTTWGSYQGWAGWWFSTNWSNWGTHCSPHYGWKWFLQWWIWWQWSTCYTSNNDWWFWGWGWGWLWWPWAWGWYSWGWSYGSWSSYSTWWGGWGSINTWTNPINVWFNNSHWYVIITKL